ncbi:hypothetical protein [Epibacterium sp. Ofav1-8]|uniref:hypothetical protein n=1 Tax=Epibacterium sp. Ofav1-8 TaxID=2917735 RepID=UPI001EF5E869|nr:hypothetical protein [Epibacterium sp. Ofav1-8]MCG7623193.1 hypothetical protein [Epibacterium sp. Ofav1-8]
MLVEPLVRLGLAKPTKLTVAQFEAMIADLCSKLAYMSDLNLQALAEQAASMPAGKNQDQFPIAAKILQWAAAIQPPPDDASPLFRAVFSDGLGQSALAEGWAPELLGHLRKSRIWPREYDLKQIRSRAEDARRQIVRQDEHVARGGTLTEAEWNFRKARRQAQDKCQRIAALVAEVGER